MALLHKFLKRLQVVSVIKYAWQPIAAHEHERDIGKKFEHAGRRFVTFDANLIWDHKVQAEAAPGFGFVYAQNDFDDLLFGKFNAHLVEHAINLGEKQEPVRFESYESSLKTYHRRHFLSGAESVALENAVMRCLSFCQEFLNRPNFFIKTLGSAFPKHYDYFVYRNTLWSIHYDIAADDCALLVDAELRRERDELNSLLDGRSKVNFGRKKLSEIVRMEVWRRDQGKCTKCGSRLRLEFDHIIPVSRGGSDTARNVELLCEACNRAKGAQV